VAGSRLDGGAPSRSGDGTTIGLLIRVRDGDTRARERLAARFLLPLKRFAHGRLPQGARGLLDTDDLVQETVIRALNHVDQFTADRPGAFLAYMRKIVINQVRDEARRVQRRPASVDLPELLRDAGPSPLEAAIGREALDRYDAALDRLNEDQREAVIMRIEWGCSFEEIAEAIGSPTENAARMVVSRAVARPAGVMHGMQVEAR